MTANQSKKSRAIIHAAAIASAAVGAGLAQFGGSDRLVIKPIQLGMIISLGTVYGISVSQSAAEATLANATTASMGRTLSRVLIGRMPVAGNAINAATAFLLTEALGQLVAREYADLAEEDQKTEA